MKTKLSRREFLRTAALTGAGLVAAACAPASTPAAPAATTAPAKPTAPAVRKPVTITLMLWGGAERYKTILDAYAKAYPDTASWLKVDVVSPGQHDAEVNQAIRLGLAAGGQGLPDLVMMNYATVPEFASTGGLVDLGSRMAAYKDLTVAGKALSSVEGKTVAIPTQPKTKLWYYRKDMFEKASLDPKNIKTADDYMAAAKKFHEVHPKSFIMNLGPQPIHYWYFMILSHWDDVRIATKDGQYQITKNPHFRDLMTWLNGWYASGLTAKIDDFTTDWGPAFADNTIGADLVSNWMDGFLPKYAQDQKGLWGRALWPEFNRTGSEAGGGTFAIPNGAKNVDAAWEFASKMYLDTKGSVEVWKINGSAPVTKSAQDEVRSVVTGMTKKPSDMSDDDWKASPVNFFGTDFMETVYQGLDILKVFPYDPKYQAELTIMRQHTEAYMAGKETIDQALNGTEADMKAQLGNPYKV